ncbi:MAG: hypothetical protein ACI4UN_00185 [Muribaculaceae bacterium]
MIERQIIIFVTAIVYCFFVAPPFERFFKKRIKNRWLRFSINFVVGVALIWLLNYIAYLITGIPM